MKNTRATTSTPKALLDELKALVGEAQGMITASISEHSAEALGDLRDRFRAAQERTAACYAEAKEKAVAGARSTDAAIREHPYPALAITLGAGVLLGVLLARRGM